LSYRRPHGADGPLSQRLQMQTPRLETPERTEPSAPTPLSQRLRMPTTAAEHAGSAPIPERHDNTGPSSGGESSNPAPASTPSGVSSSGQATLPTSPPSNAPPLDQVTPSASSAGETVSTSHFELFAKQLQYIKEKLDEPKITSASLQRLSRAKGDFKTNSPPKTRSSTRTVMMVLTILVILK
jgi:hypothetical protein